MPQIDFYIIKELNPLSFACKLCDTVYKRGHSLWVTLDSTELVQRLDDLLWTFNDISFVPHKIYQSDEKDLPPILLADTLQSPIQNELVLNLATTIPDYIFSFKRIMEIVPEDPNLKKAAREHYKIYKERGWEVTTREIKN